jgi:hypothetical protein
LLIAFDSNARRRLGKAAPYDGRVGPDSDSDSDIDIDIDIDG